jgi:nicotinate-nucleotide--dimethylbenzimidazole phosphoribosyltransferase
MSEQPFDDIRGLLADLPPAGEAGAFPTLGRLEPVAAWIAAWRGKAEVNRPILALYAGAHQGAEGEGDPRERLEAIASGQAPVALAAQHLGAGLDVFDLAIDRPVPDIATGPAMRERECAATMAFGMEVMAKQPDLLILGGFGPGAEASAQALLLALLGERGPGATYKRAHDAAVRAMADSDDPLELLRQLGGRESAALAGAILAARTQRTPVMLDGTPALAAAAVLAAVDPAAIAHCRAARPHRAAEALGLASLTDLELDLDDGAGALAVLGLVKLACALAETAGI